jgi:phosphoribosylformimino-5-aminoimidazole carboxamide ribotide isomerase
MRITNMEIIPAIDIIKGKCVRLYQGDYSRKIVYSDNPVEVALRWQNLGALRLHIVDLDGAAAGDVLNIAVVEKIVRGVRIPVELGGGIRTLPTIERLLGIGVGRVILGTAAVEDAKLVEEACRKFKDGIVIGVDVRDGYVATRGWLKAETITAVDFVRRMMDLKGPRFIYTDIVRDGTLTGPNYAGVDSLIKATRCKLIVAGGVASISHLQKLAQYPVEGAIIGKALYTGDIDLKMALSTVK